MNETILSLGGNLGNRIENIRRALDYIKERIGNIRQCSSIYESEPWGFEAEHHFLNAVVVVETTLQPEVLLQKSRDIESLMRRVRNEKGYSSRTMDIDILFFNDDIIQTPELTIPHPRLHERRFVLFPLLETMPDKIHPVFNKSITELLLECEDKGACEKRI